MANKDNQSKQYRIYIKESKSWVDVNKEFYTNYYRDINAYRKRQQEHGRCVCPASKRYLCDMDCMTCPYVKAGDQLSLDNTVSDGEGNEKSCSNMPPKGHSILSASSSDRWLHCPPSARLCETYEDKGSDYAAEGTDAHALCEYKLLKALRSLILPAENKFQKKSFLL